MLENSTFGASITYLVAGYMHLRERKTESLFALNYCRYDS